MKCEEQQSGRPVASDRCKWHTTQTTGQGNLHHRTTERVHSFSYKRLFQFVNQRVVRGQMVNHDSTRLRKSGRGSKFQSNDLEAIVKGKQKE